MKEEEVKNLLDKYLNGSAKPEEVKLLDDFFDSQVDGEDDEFTAIQDLDEIKENSYLKLKNNTTSVKSINRKSFRNLFYILALSLLVISVWVLGNDFNHDPTWVVKFVPYGENEEVILEDGTHVTLNSGSTLTYPEKFRNDGREVRLEGEAFFDVAHDKSRPFTVISGQLTTTVLGTSFNLKAFQEYPIVVSVLTGKVKLSKKGQAIKVKAGEQAVFKDENQRFNLTEGNVEKAILWKKGVISFEDSDLISALEVLNRYYNVHFITEENLPENRFITAEFDNTSLGNVLESFKFVMNIDYSYINDSTVLIK